jgi:hypothetical protein
MQTRPWGFVSLSSLLSLITAYSSPARGVPWQQGSDSIPKIIHQSWKTDQLPPNLRRWQDTIRLAMRLVGPECRPIKHTDTSVPCVSPNVAKGPAPHLQVSREAACRGLLSTHNKKLL